MKALPVLDERAGGIDVGSERLHVSVGGEVLRVFGTLTSELKGLVQWLLEQRVRSVALEATGVYWMYLYDTLQAAGLEVLVVNARQVRNLPGRKTDMADCQWLATLHAHGLLRSGFVPPEQIRRLQDYVRLRDDHIVMAASHVQHMQKALERMNVKLHDVISELTGVSGMKLLRAILAGERDPARLLELCELQIKRHKAQRVIESLRGTWKPEHLFALRHAVNAWDFYQAQILECDRAIEQVLHELGGPPDAPARPGAKPGGCQHPAHPGPAPPAGAGVRWARSDHAAGHGRLLAAARDQRSGHRPVPMAHREALHGLDRPGPWQCPERQTPQEPSAPAQSHRPVLQRHRAQRRQQLGQRLGRGLSAPEGAPRRLGGQQGPGTQARRDVLARHGPWHRIRRTGPQSIPSARGPKRTTRAAQTRPQVRPATRPRHPSTHMKHLAYARASSSP